MFMTKAQVVNPKLGSFSVTVPLLSGKSGSTTNAIICANPGIKPQYRKGDTVLVGFEDNDFGKPVVVGALYNDASSVQNASAIFNELECTGATVLSSDTTIGDIKYSEIQCLKGMSSSIKDSIDNIEKYISSQDNTVLEGIKKMVLSSDMYGDKNKMDKIKDPVVGQLFFIIGGAD